MRKLVFAILLLSLFGAADAGYLTWVHYAPDTEGSNVVNKGNASLILGIPTSIFGLVAYVLLFALAYIFLTLHDSRAAGALLLVSLAGFLYSLYLSYMQIYVIYAICPLCMLSQFLLFLILLLSFVIWKRSDKYSAIQHRVDIAASKKPARKKAKLRKARRS
ncbi:vitamin K epoxide reductase family protein [Candidatus Woesearchaeota archaeon]|nr:vitamin K epoxide reductase family protein [Candidatus Woesearchaeota archaeon]